MKQSIVHQIKDRFQFYKTPLLDISFLSYTLLLVWIVYKLSGIVKIKIFDEKIVIATKTNNTASLCHIIVFSTHLFACKT